MQQLTIDNLVLHSQRPLLHGVSLTLTRGRVLALVGSSGSGKSLTCAATLGVLPAGVKQKEGAVRLNGAPVTPGSLRGSVVATIMQNPRSAFNPLRTMRDHASETCKALGKPFETQHFVALLQDVGLDDPQRLLSLYPFEMSGGMLQRTMVALALLSDAPFLIADEPTTDLDVVAQARILDLLDAIMQRRSPGLLLVTHDMGVVARLADDVAVMSDGRIVEQADVESIFHTPRHPVTRQLVAAHLALYGLELAS